MGVLQRFERRLEGMVGLAFARMFKGKVHPAEIAKALQREADEQRSVLGEGRVLAPNVYIVSLGRTAGPPLVRAPRSPLPRSTATRRSRPSPRCAAASPPTPGSRARPSPAAPAPARA